MDTARDGSIIRPEVPVGPLGVHPRERSLIPNDRGALRIGVIAEVGSYQVVVEFGTPVQLLGLNPRQARSLAESIIDKANLVERARLHAERAGEKWSSVEEKLRARRAALTITT